jgi:hypothetical protein
MSGFSGRLTILAAIFPTVASTIFATLTAPFTALLAKLATLTAKHATFLPSLTDPATAFAVANAALVHARATPAVDVEADCDVLG